jgi:hypothetical protein
MKTNYLPRKMALKAAAFFLLTTFGIMSQTIADNPPTGAIKGRFTINSDNEKVYFSQGNLQYQASTNTWRFAENQYDFVGQNNMYISATYDGWIDLFAWGTSGYNHGAACYQPWSINSGGGFNGSGSMYYYAYGNNSNDLNDETGQADWGYNAISNGGNEENQWRTLAMDEWEYVFNIRTTPSGLRYAKAIVNDVKGVILLPDGWDASIFALNNCNTFGSQYADNVVSASDWNVMEDAGAVFMPSSGSRLGTNVNGYSETDNENARGNYWSTTHESTDGAYFVMVSNASLSPHWHQYRFVGLSVRLVQSAPSVNYTMQTTEFTSGWNWYSSYIDQNEVDGFSLLTEGLGANSIQIKAQQQYANYYEGMGWVGMLTDINNESTYKIKNAAPCTVGIIGLEALSEQHPITLTPGWNWIGYPCSEPMAIETAFSNITVTDGDLVKALNGYATYYEGWGWIGSLRTITPGMGLLYKSYSNQNTTLIYPANARGLGWVENITPDDNHWVPDLHAYPDNMTVTAIVELDGMELEGDNYEIAAFADGECRGSVPMMYVEPLDRYMALLTLSGEEATSLHFGLYNAETGEECFNADETLSFEADAVIGEVDAPFVIRFRNTTGVDEWTKSLQVYPNPVEHGQTITLGLSAEEMGEVQVEIINALGVVETVHATPLQTITAPNVAGVYTLKITVEGKGTCFRKMVVR